MKSIINSLVYLYHFFCILIWNIKKVLREERKENLNENGGTDCRK